MGADKADNFEINELNARKYIYCIYKSMAVSLNAFRYAFKYVCIYRGLYIYLYTCVYVDTEEDDEHDEDDRVCNTVTYNKTQTSVNTYLAIIRGVYKLTFIYQHIQKYGTRASTRTH